MESGNLLQKLDEYLPLEDDLLKQIMLTSSIAWQNILTKKKIEDWLSNFQGKVFPQAYERRVALWLLSNFVYYNQEEVRYLCKSLFNKFIHRMLLKSGNLASNTLRKEFEKIIDSTRFFCLGEAGESGSFILYYFRQENGLKLKSFIPPSKELMDSIQNVVFIDDVTISGSQASQYLDKKSMALFEDKRQFLLTLASTNQATRKLEKHNIEVISCINLDDRSRCFSDKSGIFPDIEKSLLGACKKFAEFYGKISLKGYSIKYPVLGYGGGQYLFGFFYNTPSNTLPIFWVDSDNWLPIFGRHEKYQLEVFGKYGRFI